jgi:hypothetical protein
MLSNAVNDPSIKEKRKKKILQKWNQNCQPVQIIKGDKITEDPASVNKQEIKPCLPFQV